MRHKRLLSACLSAFLLIPLNSCSRPLTAKTPSAANTQSPPATKPQREERLVIAYGGEDGKTALDLLKVKARVRTAASPLGELVEEINGVANGNGYYLFYFVNGATAKTGAANYVTQSGDKIEWKLIGPQEQ